MGYRHYLYIVEKKEVERIVKCRTLKDLDAEFGEDFALYDLGKEYISFGKWYENYKEIQKIGKPLFEKKEFKERFEEYEPYLCNEKAILSAIEYNKKKINDFYEELLKEEDIEGMTQAQRMKRHCKSYKNWWAMDILNLDKDNKELTSSWLYEHEIFNLVAKYKDFDSEKYSLIFMGW